MLTEKVREEIKHQLKVFYNKGYARGKSENLKKAEAYDQLADDLWKIKDYDRVRQQNRDLIRRLKERK